jgi:hypothetical protein
VDEIKVPCPACDGVGQKILRVQYRDNRGCRNEMRDCLICDGHKELTVPEAAEFERKYPTAKRRGDEL